MPRLCEETDFDRRGDHYGVVRAYEVTRGGVVPFDDKANPRPGLAHHAGETAVLCESHAQVHRHAVRRIREFS
jgi:hypothetical protein